MSLPNYFVNTNYDVIPSIQDDLLNCGVTGNCTGLVPIAWGLAEQSGCEGVYHNGGPALHGPVHVKWGRYRKVIKDAPYRGQ